MTLEFTMAAISDLQSIRSYTLQAWGCEQEQCYLDALWKKFEEILADPRRWRLREDLFPGCRVAAQGKHVILFQVEGSVLKIVRILHAAMDFPRPTWPPNRKAPAAPSTTAPTSTRSAWSSTKCSPANAPNTTQRVEIDVRLDEIVLRALEKEPARRYQTAGEFRTVVETIASGSNTPPQMAREPQRASTKQTTKPRGMSKNVLGEENEMTEQNESKFGKLALALSLGGVILAVAIGVLARLAGYRADMPAYLVFLAFQVAAMVLGLIAWRTPLGKAAAITSVVLAVSSLTLL